MSPVIHSYAVFIYDEGNTFNIIVIMFKNTKTLTYFNTKIYFSGDELCPPLQ